MAEAVANEPESRQEEHKGSLLTTVFMTIVLLYFGGFALLIIDTIFLGERLWSLLPDFIETDAQQAVQTIYAPLIWLLDLII